MDTWITICVLRGRDLAIADANGFSDPYAVVTLGRQKKKTKTIKKTLNPVWNESFTLQMTTDQATITVWDWDMASSDDFLGTITIELTPSLLDGTERWFTLGQRYKDTKENVSGDICLSFTKSLPPSSSKKPRNTNLVDEIKQRLNEAQINGGQSVDLSACELTRIPLVVMNTFIETMNINFSFNKLTTILPEFSDFTMLEELDLTGNLITYIPPTVSKLARLRELHLNGNRLTEVPDDLVSLTKLEKLYLSNNHITVITTKLGSLRKLEELYLNGNPLGEGAGIPPSIGCCQMMEIVDFSACSLTYIPGEFTYMTKLLELNLATNRLKELPQSLGRMTRLVRLNVSDNQLTDLPISLGNCFGLAKFGAGISLERNPIRNEEMMRKYQVGPDHMVDYLEKRLMITSGFKLEEFDLSRFDPSFAPKKKEVTEAQKPAPAINTANTDTKLEEKLLALKRWGNTTIQSELRIKINEIQQKAESSSQLEVVMQVAQLIKQVKPEMEKARPLIPPYEPPKANLVVSAPKIDQLKAVINAALAELALCLRGIQAVMNDSNNSKDVVTMVQFIKNFKQLIEKEA